MTLYKILARCAFEEAKDRLPWSRVDEADGFVHLSDASRVRETALRHFAGLRDLVLVELDSERFEPGTLRWEPSRGGALFPHVYGDVPLAAVVSVHELVPAGAGFVFPATVP